MGSGIGSISLDGLIATISEILNAAGPAGLRIGTHPVPLIDAEEA